MRSVVVVTIIRGRREFDSTMPSTDSRDRLVLAVLAVVAILVVLSGVLIAQAALAAVGIAIPLVALYLLWRFVRAHERIADALE